jgi:hypothetical protein
LKGDLALALNLHPLSPLALTALLIIFLGGPCRSVWEHAGWRPVPKESLRFFWAGSLLLFLAYGTWRICSGNTHERELGLISGNKIQYSAISSVIQIVTMLVVKKLLSGGAEAGQPAA